MTMKEVYPSGKSLSYRIFHEVRPDDGYDSINALSDIYVLSNRVSTRTPNYPYLKSIGQLPVNNYSFRDYRLSHLGSSSHRIVPSLGVTPWTRSGPLLLFYFSPLSYNWNGYFPLLSISDSGFDSQLATRFLNRLREGNWNAAVSLGELGETARFLSHRGGMVGRVLLTMLGQWKGSSDHHRYFDKKQRRWLNRPSRESLHNLWLEYQYALKPLVNDIQSALGVLNDSDYLETKQVSVSVSKQYRDSGRYKLNFGAYDTDFVLDVVSSGTRSGRMTIEFAVENPFLNRINALGFLNPMSYLWERTPYSFVFDWFLPLGDYLDNFTATAGYSFRRGWQTVKSEMNHQGSLHCRFGRPDGPPPTWSGSSSETVVGKQFGFDRVRLTSFPTPPLPQFRFGGLFSQYVTGASLVRQRFPSRR